MFSDKISDGHDQNDHVIVFKQTFDRLAETMNVTFCWPSEDGQDDHVWTFKKIKAVNGQNRLITWLEKKSSTIFEKDPEDHVENFRAKSIGSLRKDI